MIKIKREAKIGLFAVVSLAALYFGYNFLRGKKLFSGQYIYYVVYDNIDGINKSTPIYYKGLKVGQVEELAFLATDSANRIIASLAIDKNVVLSTTTQACIVSPDILGGKAISLIVPDILTPIAKGDTIDGTQEIGIGESISGMIEPVKNKTENVLVSLNKVLGELQIVLGNGGSQQLASGLEDLSVTMKNLSQVSENLNTIVKKESDHIAKSLANVESLTTNLKNNNKEISSSIQHIHAISDSVSKAPIKSMIEELNQTAKSLNNLTQKLNTGNGSAAKLISDSMLYNNLNQSAFELQALLKDLRTYPARYVNVSVFGNASKKADNQRTKDLKKVSK